MLTFFIILVGLIVLSSIIAGVIQAENAEFALLYALALVIVLVSTITFVLEVNKSEEIFKSKTLEKPQIKIETIQSDSSIVKSDTTYIYTFKRY
jgi:hypothetical protein